MARRNPKNERIKHRYFAYLEEANRLSPISVDQVATALTAFEKSTGGRDFAAFHIEQARKFKRDLAEATNAQTGKPLAKSTINSRLMAGKNFFFWLASQPGYRSRIGYSDCDYFNPSAQDTRIATAKRPQKGPELDDVLHVIGTAPCATVIERRNRALIAFTLLSGMRDAAIASLPLGLVDLEASSVEQDARRVKTKNAKTMTTYFFPVGDLCRQVLAEWIQELREVHRFRPDDPLFPATAVGLDGTGQFKAIGIKPEFWSNATAIRRIFKERFEAAGLPYANPHSLRHTLARLGEQRCSTPEEFKAWSQNLGHERVLTTLTSYGAVDLRRQRDLILNLTTALIANPENPSPPPEVLKWFEQLRGTTERG
jgi:integrase